jgi:L-serine dehydratase
MFLSVFDMFKVGIGPSSSHTMGPMVAAGMFLDLLRASPFEAAGLKARLHGSLAFTGVGPCDRSRNTSRIGRIFARNL